MKKVLSLVLVAAMLVSLVACAKPATQTATAETQPAVEAKKTIYVLGPTPDHGWTAQAGTYAQQKCEEIKNAGKYNAVYMPASTGEQQVDQVNQILANGDACGVMFFALDDTAKAGQEALIAKKVPFISFDRIIEGPDKYAILNASGDNWQCGAGIAYWLQKNGLKPGSTTVVLFGDNGTVCGRRKEGFEQFLRGEVKYHDDNLKQDFETTEKWNQEDLDKLFDTYKVVCNWSADGAYQYLEQKLPEIAEEAKNNGGNLYVYSMDDEMTFGLLNLLEGNALTEDAKKNLESLNIYTSAIGGMQELYDVMAGKSAQSGTAKKYFDDLMSMYFSPKMIKNVIDYMVKYCDGNNWQFNTGDGKYEPTWIVDASNVANFEGFTGH